METFETETMPDGVLWAGLECQICDHVEWVRGFNVLQQSLSDLEMAVSSAPALAGAFG